MADSLFYLTQAQQILEELAMGLVGPVSAMMSCVEACHSVATALVALGEVAMRDNPQEDGSIRLLRPFQ
jgi:hypothetical protein